jgi:hypothetical protein
MNIYEIVALNEIEIPSGAVVQAAPGVNPSMYRVTYPPEMNKIPDLISGEDLARRTYSDKVERWNSSSRQRRQELRRENRERANRAKARAREDRARARERMSKPGAEADMRGKWNNFIRPLSRLAGVVLITNEINDTLIDQMMRAYRTYVTSPEEDALEAQQIYTITTHRIFGLWLASVNAAAFLAIRRTVQLGQAAKLLSGIRAANLATSLAGFFTGPISLIKFILIEGAVWAVIWYIKTSENGQKVIAEYLIASSVTGPALSFIADMFQLGANGLESAITDYAGLDSATITTALTDLQDTLGMSQADIAARTQAADAADGTAGLPASPDRIQGGDTATTGGDAEGGDMDMGKVLN